MTVTGRDLAICDATLALLAEVGYDRMSMDAVAARAHASKATIYRRWPGKRELVLDALHTRHSQHGPSETPPDTGSLRGDLVTSMRAMAQANAGDGCDEGELMAGVLRAMRHAPELGDCMRRQVLERKRETFRTIIDRAVERGELPAAAPADLAHEVAGALWVQRVLVVSGEVDDAFIAHVADDVLIPLLSHVPTHADLAYDQETP